MRKTQIQLTDDMYQTLRRRAFREGCSLSALVRQLLEQSLRQSALPAQVHSFSFIGSGNSHQVGPAISENHDEALWD